ncbi:MAG: hypothetical protein ACRDZZ_15540, partial [Ilumatobacteraceae bacterium]
MNDAFEPVFPRIDRDPATDAGGRSAATSDTSTNGASGAHGAPDTPAGPTGEPAGFRFNLDEALARLTEPHQPIQRFTWSAVTPATELAPPASSVPLLPPGLLVPGPGAPAPAPAEQVAPAPAPPAPAVPAPLVSAPVASAFPELASRVTSLDEPVAGEAADPLPPIQEATPSDGAPTTLLWTNGSASAPAPAPHAFAPSPESAPPAPAAAPAPTIVTGTQAFAAGSAGFTPDMPYAPNAVSVREVPVGDGAPRLPEAPPAAAPPMATMASATMVAPTTRSTAAKGRKKRKRRRLGRVVLVLFLLAGLVGAALMFGSDYLFPEDWDKDVVPTVEALQSQTGLEFADPVGINLVPDAEYGARVAGNVFGSTFGEDWTAAVPRWRALGLVDGEPTAESVNAIVSTWIPAHYDPADGQIYRSATATGPALDAAMADALAAALLDQQDPAAKAADPAVTATPATPATAAAAPSLASIAVADVRTELVAGGITADADRSALAT